MAKHIIRYPAYSSYNKNSMNYNNIWISNVRNESVQRKVENLRNSNYDVASISKRLSSAFDSNTASYTNGQKIIKPQQPIISKIEVQR